MAWQNRAKKLAAGKWIRFDDATPMHVVTFIGEPTEVTKVSTMGDRKGEEYTVLSFPVLVDGDEKKLEPNNSLLNAILAEDEDEEIMGATVLIKCLNLKTKREWKIKRMKEDTDQKTITAKEKLQEKEEKKEEATVEQAGDEEEKKKFMEGVQKTAAKRKRTKKAEEGKTDE